jgi:hypothetical protein
MKVKEKTIYHEAHEGHEEGNVGYDFQNILYYEPS